MATPATILASARIFFFFCENIGFENSTDVSLYCAYQLYVDFLWIFLRVFLYLTIFSSRRR